MKTRITCTPAVIFWIGLTILLMCHYGIFWGLGLAMISPFILWLVGTGIIIVIAVISEWVLRIRRK